MLPMIGAPGDGGMTKRLLTLMGGFSVAALVIVAALAKAAVIEPLPPHKTGPGVIQMPCLCMHSPAAEKAFVEEAMHAAVIPARRK
jgi:hypothetical protein